MQRQIASGGVLRHLRLVKAIQLAIVGCPIGTAMLGLKSPYVIPPLGPLSEFVVPLALVAVGMCGIVPWFLNLRQQLRRLAITSLILAVMFMCVYAVLIMYFVATIHPPNRPAIHVTVGTERTTFAKANYPNTSNEEIVYQYGNRDEDLDQLWTHGSITFTRCSLLGAYLMSWAMVNMFIGSFAKASEIPPPPVASRTPTRVP
jgi:hypothetical protein